MISNFKGKIDIQLIMKILTFTMAAIVVVPMPFITGSQYFWFLVALTIFYNLYLLIKDFKKYIKLYKWEMLFIISCFISAFINHKYNNIYSIVKVLFTAVIIFNMLTINVNITEEKVLIEDKIINRCLLIFTLVLGIITFVMFIANPINIIKGERLIGIYYNANQMGFWCFISIIISSFNFKNNKFFHFFNIVLQTILLVLSGCRSALISLAILFLYLLSKVINDKIKFKKIMIATFATMFVFVFANTIIRYQWMFRSIDEYYMDYIINALTGMRYKLWKDAFLIFAKRPIFGVGVDNLYNAAFVVLSQDSYIFVGNWEDAHNILLTLLSYTGIVGTSIFIKVIYDKIKKAINNKMFDELVVVICLLIIALLDIGIVFDNRVLSVYFWYVIGRININEYFKYIKIERKKHD